MTKASVWIIQDRETEDTCLGERLRGMGYETCTLFPGRRAVEDAVCERPDLLLIDLGLGGDLSGTETAKQLRESFDVPVIYMTDGDCDLPQPDDGCQPYGYLLKPVAARQADLSIKAALDLHENELRSRERDRTSLRMIRELRRRQSILDVVLANMEEGVVVADPAGNFLLTNSRREQIIGKGLAALEPAEWPSTYGAFHLDKTTQFPTEELPLVRAMRGETTEDVELFIRNEARPAGAYVRARGRPLLDDAHKIIGGVALFSDITKYKTAEADLERTISEVQDQAQLMETVFESISDGVVVADSDGQFTIFNASAREIVGMGMMKSAPDQWACDFGLFNTDKKTHFPTDQIPLLRALRGEASDDVEMFIRNEKKPEGVYVSVNGRPLKKNAQAHGGGVVTFRDVSDRKTSEIALRQALEELREQSELMETIFNSISEGLVVVNTDGEVLNVNPVGRQIAGVEMLEPSRTRLVRKWADYYYPDRETLIPSAELPINRVIFRGEPASDLTMFVRTQLRPDGFFVRTSVRPLLHSSGDIRGAVVIFRDVTDQVQAEEALVQAFSQGRLEIIDTILHNIGNAINSVTIGIDTVRETLSDNQPLRRLRSLADIAKTHQANWVEYISHDPQGQRFLPYFLLLVESLAAQNNTFVETATRVGDRAHHVADIVRTQKSIDKPHMAKKDLVLESTLSAAVKVLHESLIKRGIMVRVHCGDAPRMIRIQESRFHQMMVNLIKNSVEAIDHLVGIDGLREPPRICIRACPDGDFLNLDVIDNGIGIDSRNLKLVFAAAYSTKEGGTGLGLHSAANFVIGMGGRIEALSDGPGMGTTLRIVLPLSSIAADSEGSPPVSSRVR